MVGKGVKRGAVALVPSASTFVSSPAGNERTAMSVEREGGREEREKEKRRGDYLKLAESLVRQQS